MNYSSIKVKKSKNKVIFSILGILGIFITWLILSLIINNDFILPTPMATFVALGNLLIKFHTYQVFLYTFIRIIFTTLVAFLLGVIFSSIASYSRGFKEFINPLMVLLKTIPVASIIILLLIMVGKDVAPLFITFLVIFPIFYEGSLQALLSISKDIKEDVALLPGSNVKKFFKIFLPITKDTLITCLLQGFGLGFKVMIMAEFLAQPNGSIGREMMFSKQYLEIDDVFAWTLLLITVVFVIDSMLKYLKKRMEQD